MKFLANENFPYPGIINLRQSGFDVTSIFELHSGYSDQEVIDLAKEKKLIILTFDRDYGEIIFRYALPDPPAVIYFRFKGTDPLSTSNKLLELLINGDIDFSNSFTIIGLNNIRQRKYKSE